MLKIRERGGFLQEGNVDEMRVRDQRVHQRVLGEGMLSLFNDGNNSPPIGWIPTTLSVDVPAPQRITLTHFTLQLLYIFHSLVYDQLLACYKILAEHPTTCTFYIDKDYKVCQELYISMIYIYI